MCGLVSKMLAATHLIGFGAGSSDCSCTPPGSATVTGTASLFSGFTMASGVVGGMFDGNTTDTNQWFTNGQTAGGISVDWGVGAKVYVDKVKYYGSASTSQGNWIFEGSDDDSNWFTIGPSSFSLVNGNATNETNLSPASKIGYRYTRLRKLNDATSTSSGPFVHEIQLSFCTC